jgi:hypothetical protein
MGSARIRPRKARLHLFIFQQMDKLAQRTIVTAIRHCSGVGRRQAPAKTAPRLIRFGRQREWTEQPFSRDQASTARNRTYAPPA